MDIKYTLDFTHSDYRDSSWYLKSPTGKRLWIDSTGRKYRDEFLEELNGYLEDKSARSGPTERSQ